MMPFRDREEGGVCRDEGWEERERDPSKYKFIEDCTIALPLPIPMLSEAALLCAFLFSSVSPPFVLFQQDRGYNVQVFPSDILSFTLCPIPKEYMLFHLTDASYPSWCIINRASVTNSDVCRSQKNNLREED